MEKLDDLLLTRVEQIPSSEIMTFVRNAQRRKVTMFAGFEVKNKNLPHFQAAICKLYIKGDPHVKTFVEGMMPLDDESSDSVSISLDSDKSLSDTAAQVIAQRDQLLNTMKDLVTTLHSQSKELETLRNQVGDMKTELLLIKSRETHEDLRNVQYINYLTDLLREVRALQSGQSLNKGYQ